MKLTLSRLGKLISAHQTWIFTRLRVGCAAYEKIHERIAKDGPSLQLWAIPLHTVPLCLVSSTHAYSSRTL